MKKALLTLAVIGLASASSVSASVHRGSSSTAMSGTTTEVRYVSSPSHRKGKPVSKLIITRDASGRIISVKRG